MASPALLAPAFGVASLALGVRATAVHRRRMEGENIGDPRLAVACLALGAALALLLSPLVSATVGGYAAYAGTVALAMATQAWLLLPPNLVTRVGACAALLGVSSARRRCSRCSAELLLGLARYMFIRQRICRRGP